MQTLDIERLITTVDLLDQGSLIICTYDFYDTLKMYEDEITKRLENENEINTQRIHYETEYLDEKISKLIRHIPENQKQVLMITSETLTNKADLPRINLIRDILTNFDLPLIWWIHEFSVPVFKNLLPDLWRIKANIFSFKYEFSTSEYRSGPNSKYFTILRRLLNASNRVLANDLSNNQNWDKMLEIQKQIKPIFTLDLHLQTEDSLISIAHELIQLNETDIAMEILRLIEIKLLKNPSQYLSEKNRKLAEIEKKFAVFFEEKNFQRETRFCYAKCLRFHPNLLENEKDKIKKKILEIDSKIGTNDILNY